ncbi:hypothetical protein [Lignipirellula cremea]|uniref:Uncharacterized protein n=1 Tax=Lignipirellula cremea TaxID=2528010 RepID=A0A518DXQ4_9BACT|nr:hypothetical protein [Lignipirellula cremea]QDU96620.1 hypothetical protein Pla8534_44410 [Lignipirellula cremea]
MRAAFFLAATSVCLAGCEGESMMSLQQPTVVNPVSPKFPLAGEWLREFDPDDKPAGEAPVLVRKVKEGVFSISQQGEDSFSIELRTAPFGDLADYAIAEAVRSREDKL